MTDDQARMAGLHPETIKAAIRMKSGSIVAFEREHGLRQGSVADAIRKGRPLVERAIAAVIGKTPEEIWPERFVRKGRKMRSPRITTSRRAPARQMVTGI